MVDREQDIVGKPAGEKVATDESRVKSVNLISFTTWGGLKRGYLTVELEDRTSVPMGGCPGGG